MRRAMDDGNDEVHQNQRGEPPTIPFGVHIHVDERRRRDVTSQANARPLSYV